MKCPYFVQLLALVLVGRDLLAAGDTAAGAMLPAPPRLPRIVELRLEPASLTFASARDERRVLVWGKTEAGDEVDVTAEASFKTAAPIVEFADGYVVPRAEGAGEMT